MNVSVSQALGLIGLTQTPNDLTTFLGASGRLEAVASTVASFSFTMMGFLAAVLALFSLMPNSTALAYYREDGHLPVLLLTVVATVLELAMTFAMAMRWFFVTPTVVSVRVVAWLVTADLFMLACCTIPVLMLLKRSLGARDANS